MIDQRLPDNTSIITMGANLGIDAMIGIADGLLSELSPELSGCVMPLILTGRRPNLDTQPIADLSKKAQMAQLPSTIREAIERAINNAVNIMSSDTQSAFTTTILKLVSQEGTGGLSDKDMEERVCVIFEKNFKQKLDKLVSSAIAVIRKRYPPFTGPDIKRPSTFASVCYLHAQNESHRTFKVFTFTSLGNAKYS